MRKTFFSMIHFSLSQPDRFAVLQANPIFAASIDWIQKNGAQVAPGIHELGEEGWYANAHGYTTQERALCAWENHRHTVDLQFLIEGTEVIDVTSRELLELDVYKEEADAEKFLPADVPFSQVVVAENEAIVLFPGEAHRPKVALQDPCALRKLVVKIPVRLLGTPH